MGRAHTTPQSPQFSGEVISVSQPFEGLLSQLFQPLVHAGEQELTGVPALQVLLVTCTSWVWQVSPHVSQFALVPMAVSHPGMLLLQSLKPGAH